MRSRIDDIGQQPLIRLAPGHVHMDVGHSPTVWLKMQVGKAYSIRLAGRPIAELHFWQGHALTVKSQPMTVKLQPMTVKSGQ